MGPGAGRGGMARDEGGARSGDGRPRAGSCRPGRMPAAGRPGPVLGALALLGAMAAASVPAAAADAPSGFVLIRPGTFLMGLGEDKRPVEIARPFYLGVTEVTQAEYESVMGVNPSYFRIGPDQPVERVSWLDALVYCNARSEREGLTPAYRMEPDRLVWDPEADGYRLPMEIEWEYACRAGTDTPFSCGDCLGTDRANYHGYRPMPGCPEGLYREQPVAVGSFPANPWGLHDMHGNVYEWCWDPFAGEEAEEADGPGSDLEPIGPDLAGPGDDARRVLRGGCWAAAESKARSGSRQGTLPEHRFDFIGLRVARWAPAGAGREGRR